MWGQGLLPGGRGMCLRAGSPFIHCSFQGFDEDLQQEGTLLGQFTYNQDGEPIQTFYFQVQDSVMPAEVACSLSHPLPCARLQGFRAGGLPCPPAAQGIEQRQLSM